MSIKNNKRSTSETLKHSPLVGLSLILQSGFVKHKWARASDGFDCIYPVFGMSLTHIGKFKSGRIYLKTSAP